MSESKHTYMLEPGRCIMRDGKLFAGINRQPGASPAEIDDFAVEAIRAVNAHADLLAACKEALEIVDCYTIGAPEADRQRLVSKTLRAAIAKAEKGDA